MTHSAPNLDEPLSPEGLARVTLTECAEALALIRERKGHPNLDLAVHALDLHLAAARVVDASDDAGADLTAGADSLGHICPTHIEAALLLIGGGRKPGPEGAAQVVRAGLHVVRHLLT